MSKLEWKFFISSNACVFLAYHYIIPLWEKVNEAKSSFAAELYWFPIILIALGSVVAVLFWIGLVKMLFRNIKKGLEDE